MRYEVPQFIEIEDKIFGPFTWRQFLYLGGGVGMAVVMFITLPFILFVILGLPLAVISAALAFYPVNNRPFSFFLEAIFNYLTKQRTFFWRQRPDIVYRAEQRSRAQAAIAPAATLPPTRPEQIKSTNINSLARKLELEAIQKKE